MIYWVFCLYLSLELVIDINSGSTESGGYIHRYVSGRDVCLACAMLNSLSMWSLACWFDLVVVSIRFLPGNRIRDEAILFGKIISLQVI